MDFLRCDFCNRRIEKLNEAEALEDMFGHGWSNFETADCFCCYDCFDTEKFVPYEAYLAGRIVKAKNGEIRIYEGKFYTVKGKWK